MISRALEIFGKFHRGILEYSLDEIATIDFTDKGESIVRPGQKHTIVKEINWPHFKTFLKEKLI